MPRNNAAPGLSSHASASCPDERPAGDFYRTPPQGVTRLLVKEKIVGPVWEPACGDGRISKVLKESGYTVYSSDLYRRGYGRGGVDFLTYAPCHRFQTIMTNPPFTHIQQFAERALELGPDKVLMLGRLLFLEGAKRKEFFETSGLTRVWVFSGRINVGRADYAHPGNLREQVKAGRGGMVAFAWYVWERGHRGPPTLGWI